MKRLLILCATVLASALPASVSLAQTIECASEVPAGRSGHWYYRIIDGRKCWYQGKAMMPKSSLHWPKESVSEAEATASEEQAEKPTTDGRNVVAPPTPSGPAARAAWPTPVVDEISFESRWLGLKMAR